jgi:hypothetical protein
MMAPTPPARPRVRPARPADRRASRRPARIFEAPLYTKAALRARQAAGDAASVDRFLDLSA